jgi:membrane fusion protein (multidrug efflux system)
MRTTYIILAVCLLAGLVACKREEPAQAPPSPPVKVSVVTLQAREVPLYLEFVGQISGFKDIAIRARVEGFVEGVHFQEGSKVEEGALLYTLESQKFEADVAAKMSRVAEARTMLAKAEGDLGRIKPLAEIRAVSQSDLDAAVAGYEAARASVEAALANLRASQIQLGYTRIYSPITGLIGKTQAKVGDFVGREPNPVILNTVSMIDSVLVDFFITESQYLDFARKYIQRGGIEDERQQSTLQLILIDGSLYELRGKTDFIGREVDPTTGAILVQASFPNPDMLLRPGQFARVKVLVATVKEGILVPQRSVMELQGRYNVYVVDESNTVRAAEIGVGPKVGSSWLVTGGLTPGQKVIYEGLQMVREGGVVAPAEARLPAPEHPQG